MTPRTPQPPPMLRPTRIEVDLDAIRDNVATFASHTGTEVCAVVKGDGYGHGAVPVARAALDGGATWLAVALVEEGLVLRQAGIDAPILVLSEPPIAAIEPLLDAELTPVVYRPPFLAALDAAARRRPDPWASTSSSTPAWAGSGRSRRTGSGCCATPPSAAA
jgi:alanine racemase